MIQADAAPIEYTVYTFDLPSPSRLKGDIPWKRHYSSLDRNQAMEVARDLLHTQRFDRIEIKQKFFDPKLGRNVDRTFRTLGKNGTGWSALFSHLWRNSGHYRLLIDR